jgi:glutamate synthase domain-containing protein 3
MLKNNIVINNQSLELLNGNLSSLSTALYGRIKLRKNAIEINADKMHYRHLNYLIKNISKTSKKIILRNICGQRYIGTKLCENVIMEIYGIPGNDLASFMNGAKITVTGNVQDGCGNTMNGGSIIIKGSAGDILGYSMRGGKIFVRDDVGYRVGIHMKEYKGNKPYIVVGGTAEDFLGEYMAGGIVVILGLNLEKEKIHNAKYVGTGMHGGVIYIHGEVTHTGKEVVAKSLNESDKKLLKSLVIEYCNHFNIKTSDEIIKREFSKLMPVSTRPYGNLYAY